MKRARQMVAMLAVTAGLVGITVATAAEPPADTGPNGEKITVEIGVRPASGPLYRGGGVPSHLAVRVDIRAPYPQTLSVSPSKSGAVTLPRDLTFHPKPGMPVCTDKKLGPATPKNILNQPPAAIIKLCPKSVIGNGRAGIYLARTNSASGPMLNDGVLVVFHAGWTAAGQPKIKIFGVSKGVNAGILMLGELRPDNTIELSVPVLPFDSAVGWYDFDVPATKPVDYNGSPLKGSVGLDPTYVMARCSAGSWLATSVALLGRRNDDGSPLGPEYRVRASDFRLPCKGRAGKPPLGKVKVKGPRSVKRGRKASFKVTLRNPSGAPSPGVKVRLSGKGTGGTAKLGRVPAATAKSVTVKPRFRRKGRVRVTFRVTGPKGAPVTVARTVTVR